MKKIILIILTLFYVTISFSQNTMVTRKWRNKENDSLVKAQTIFEARNFLVALPYFQNLLANHPNELYLKYVTGICGLYRSDMHEKSLEYLSEVYVKNRKTNDIEYDLARAQHYNYRFDDALANIDDFLKKKGLTEIQKKEAHLLQDFCNNGKELVAKPVNAKIENIGNLVNTANSEYGPSISSDESTMIFTYVGEESMGGKQNELNQPDPNGEYNEDVFITHKENGKWTKPVSMGPMINTNLNDAAVSISNDGQKIFMYRDDASDGGDIYTSTLIGDNWSAPEKLRGDVNTLYWEGSASLSADGKTLYFASERPGGIGGKDLYKATLQPDGSWRDVQNLGIEVNTNFDDDAPFIHPDGKTLFYKTEGIKSMGYNDIFVTRYNQSDTSWSKPENIGYPINTTDDDGYFVLSASGERGYYSSGKKGGFGMQDIYSVEMPPTFLKPIIETVKGKITINGKPGEAIVQVDIINKNKNYGNFASNSVSGNYLVNIVPGSSYKITYKAEGFPDQIQTIDATALNAFTEKVINVQFPLKSDVVASVDGSSTTKANSEVAPVTTSVTKTNPDNKSDATSKTKTTTDENLDGTAATTKTNTDGSDATSTTEKSDNKTKSDVTSATSKADAKKAAAESKKEAKEAAAAEKAANEKSNADAKAATAKINATETKVASKVGNESKPGLTFKIQVAALTNPKGFDYSKLKGLGKTEKNKLEDGITRITIGKFKTLNEALEFKKKVRDAGISDAFITAIYQGKRVYLTELISQGLLQVEDKK